MGVPCADDHQDIVLIVEISGSPLTDFDNGPIDR